MVPEAMMRSSLGGLAGVLRISLALGAVLATGNGCGPEVEVLTGDTAGEAGFDGSESGGTAGAGTGGAGTAGSAGATGGTAGTAGAPVQGKSVCYAAEPSDLASLETGELCTDADVCEVNACAGFASKDGTWYFAACRAQRVQLITATLLDVPGDSPLTALDNGVTWDDCDAALADGVSGEACTWPGKSCVRPTEDTCCREGAECAATELGNANAERGLLRRIRVCAPDCEKLEPDATEPVVTDCAEAAAADRCHATPACAGDFTCYGTAGDWVVSEYGDSGQMNGAMWCAGGSLVGGYGSSWGP